MIECGVNNLSKSYGANKIFDNVSFDIKTGERVGLIGNNGTGKSTIMKIIMGLEEYEGEIFYRKGIKPRYLDQIPVFDLEYSVKEVLYSAFNDIYKIKSKMNIIEKQLDERKDNIDDLMIKYGELQQSFELLGGYDIDEKVSKVTVGLGILDEMLEMKFTNLSGGEKTKIMLGKILLEKPDLLLLDEPSNHLDLKSIEWLESYLKEYKGTVLIISHDRYFLDRVVNKVIELDSSGVEVYHGNYSYYLMEKERRFIEAYNRYKENQRKINKMEEQIKRYRVWGQMRDSEKMYKRAKELEKRLAKADKIDKPILEKTKIKLYQKNIDRSGKDVLVLEDIKKGYENKKLFTNLNLKLFYQDSLAIIGDNGTGKSTLIKMIMKEKEVNHGTIKYGSNIKIGYLPQEIKFSDETVSILETFQYKYSITIGEARTELAKVMFIKDDVFKKINMLSGGEKSRLKLCMFMYENTNFMILDEPTNHLDIDSREILENTLLDYEGTILFVSHDRYFINKIATKIGEIDRGRLTFYNGDYEYYKEQRQRLLDKSIHKKKREPSKDKYINNRDENERINKSKRKELIKLEQEIEQLESIADTINKEMLENSSDASKLNQLSTQQQENNNALIKLMKRWEDISEFLER
ncbi:MAG: ABC-F family ATP-binding cassette domain-containing protein [Vallitalea sp.]|jgi:ATPase subunit of ABC transporter with duplicated ATPase domains|nr:ABC-F family ATP-binding cassette domain-containing protein [Vallitalea sp.]